MSLNCAYFGGPEAILSGLGLELNQWTQRRKVTVTLCRAPPSILTMVSVIIVSFFSV